MRSVGGAVNGAANVVDNNGRTVKTSTVRGHGVCTRGIDFENPGGVHDLRYESGR